MTNNPPAFLSLLCSEKKLCSDYKKWVSLLWERYEEYAPRDFLDRKDCDASIWEMFCATKLLDAGFCLKKSRSSDAPDLCVLYEKQKVWIECNVPTIGSGPDRVNPQPCYDSDGERIEGLYENPLENHLMRISSSLSGKLKQYEKWVEKNICSNEDVFVIALNLKNLRIAFYQKKPSECFCSLYAREERTFLSEGRICSSYAPMPLTKQKTEERGQNDPRPGIEKKSGYGAPMDFFNQKNTLIAGVLFSNDWWGKESFGEPKDVFIENVYSEKKSYIPFEIIAQTYNY